MRTTKIYYEVEYVPFVGMMPSAIMYNYVYT